MLTCTHVCLSQDHCCRVCCRCGVTVTHLVQYWRACMYTQQDLTKLASIWHGHARTHGTQRGACPATDGWSQESRVRRCRSIQPVASRHGAGRSEILAHIHHLHVPSTVHVTDTSVSYRRRRSARTGWHQSKPLTCRVRIDLCMWSLGEQNDQHCIYR